MSTLTETKSDPLVGQVIQNRYKILRLLGEGGMGSVYLAEQLSINRLMAMKVLHEQFARDEEFSVRFQREARQAALVNHPQIVTIYEFGQTEDGRLFIAMEYVEGQSLSAVIRDGPLRVERAVKIGIQIAQALQAAHRAGIIHRDVKSDNILLREGDGIKLVDFGIARPQDQTRTRLTQTGLIVGTPEYIAPEQIEGERVTEQTDIYALGVVLYEMLSGKLPFTASTPAAVLVKHLQDRPRPLRSLRRGIPEGIEQVVMKALEKSPQKRHQTMREVIAELQAALAAAGSGSDSRRRQRPAKNRQPAKSSWLVQGALVLAVVVLSAVAIWFVAVGNGNTTHSGNQSAGVPARTLSGETNSEGKLTGLDTRYLAIAEHLRTSLAYMDRGQYAEAIAQLEAAAVIDPDNPVVRTQIQRAERAWEAEKSIRRRR